MKVVRQVAAQSTEVETKKKESTILMQKKLRIEGNYSICCCIALGGGG